MCSFFCLRRKCPFDGGGAPDAAIALAPAKVDGGGEGVPVHDLHQVQAVRGPQSAGGTR